MKITKAQRISDDIRNKLTMPTTILSLLKRNKAVNKKHISLALKDLKKIPTILKKLEN